jgi:hypothetical protein
MKTTIIDTYIVDHGRRGARRPAELFGQATRMRTTSRLMGGVSKGLNADPQGYGRTCDIREMIHMQ